MILHNTSLTYNSTEGRFALRSTIPESQIAKMSPCSSEFDIEGERNSNLTDFQTRVVWTSVDLRREVRQLDLPSAIFRKNLALNKSFHLPECATEFSTSQDCSHHDSAQTQPDPKDKIEFWRPFSVDSDLTRSSPDHGSHDTAQEYLRVANQGPRGKMFPSITPSTVKIGKSNESVFTSVKKRKYQCQYCCTSYSNQGQLTGHMRMHTGSKPYVCNFPECLRSFARNEELTRHRRIHSGYKPHQCDVCKKQFGRKDHLNKHRKTHLKSAEKKIYLCRYPECGHRYTRSDALTRHHTTTHLMRASK